MNERITVIEATLAVLMTARIEAMRANNDVGHSILCHACRHLNDELKAMVADNE